MTRIKTWTRSLFNRETLREDAVAGLVLGVESVPDGLAGGLLAASDKRYRLKVRQRADKTAQPLTGETA